VKSVPNRKFKINGVGEEELDALRNIIKQVRPNGTVRQLARTLAPIIRKIATIYTYEGHLSKNLRTFRPGLQGDVLIYACEFYFGLDFTPQVINEALAERAKARKNSRTSTGSRKGQKGKKRK
jgi:ATP-dependent Lon protease